MGKRRVSPERVKFFMRVDPQDVAVFRAVREGLTRVERRRVVDAEAFRLAVRAWLDVVPANVRRAVEGMKPPARPRTSRYGAGSRGEKGGA